MFGIVSKGTISGKQECIHDLKCLELQAALLECLKSVRAGSLLVSAVTPLTGKADALALQLGKPELGCTNSWLGRLKTHHSVLFNTTMGKSTALS